MRKLARAKPKREPTIALINIVFLMLVFFMVAGALAQPMDGDMSLVVTHDLEGRPPPNALIVHPDGRLSFQGGDVADALAYFKTLSVAERETVRLVPDRGLQAEKLVALAREFRSAGATKVMIVTERGLR